MIRQTKRQPTGRCTLPMYMGFLMSEPKSTTCTRLSEIMTISHDSVNRFLLREQYEPKDLFNEGIKQLNPIGGTLSVDDTVLDKPYSFRMDLVGHFWSGKHHRVVKGLNLITLYYTDPQGNHLPVNYRVYNKADGKTKNDYFQDMLCEVLEWGLKPAYITADSWYSCTKNLKTVKNGGMGFLFAIESNRKVATAKNQWKQVQTLDIPEDGLMIWLLEFGEVKVFRTRLKNQVRHYIVYLPDTKDYGDFKREAFQKRHDQHWEIEQYHRAIKQLCSIERFQVRNQRAILNHIFASLCSFVHLQKMQISQVICSLYQWKRQLYSEVIAEFVKSFIPKGEHLNPQFSRTANA